MAWRKLAKITIIFEFPSGCEWMNVIGIWIKHQKILHARIGGWANEPTNKLINEPTNTYQSNAGISPEAPAW